MTQPTTRWKDISNYLQEGSNIDKAYNFFIEKGFTPAQSAGIVGNLAQESTLYLQSDIKNELGYYGIAQWGGSRLDGLKGYTNEKGVALSDYHTQLEYINHELETTESRAHKELSKARTATEAAEVFVNHFERSGEKPGDKGYENRKSYAENIYSNYNDDVPITEDVTPTTPIVDVAHVPATTRVDMQNIVADTQSVLASMNEEEVRKQQVVKEDAAKAAIQDKINKRNFLADLIIGTEVAFVERKKN